LSAKANGLSRVQLMQCYAESVVWSEAALRTRV
jgi:hypothetical protein